jgi:hypothetical protein
MACILLDNLPCCLSFCRISKSFSLIFRILLPFKLVSNIDDVCLDMPVNICPSDFTDQS